MFAAGSVVYENFTSAAHSKFGTVEDWWKVSHLDGLFVTHYQLPKNRVQPIASVIPTIVLFSDPDLTTWPAKVTSSFAAYFGCRGVVETPHASDAVLIRSSGRFHSIAEIFASRTLNHST